MGFFKELKEDFSQAVNELIPEEEFFNEGISGETEAKKEDSPEEDETEEEPPTAPTEDKRDLNEILEEEVRAAIDALNTDEEFIPYEEELEADLEDSEPEEELATAEEPLLEDLFSEGELTDEELLEQGFTEEELIQRMIDEDERIQREQQEQVAEEQAAEEIEELVLEEVTAEIEEPIMEEENQEEEEMEDEEMSNLEENRELEIDEEASDMELIAQLLEVDNDEDMQVDEEILADSEEEIEAEAEEEREEVPAAQAVLGRADDVTVITKGTRIEGSISSDGSLEVMGVITGDINCNGKLSIIGTVKGTSQASEIYVNTARLDGGLISDGSVKVGVGTIVVGDIKAGSAVIAGAIKGEVDVNGPVIIDSTAIVKGNISAKSVQINNGAVIDGYCSLSYAAVDIDNFFDGDK